MKGSADMIQQLDCKKYSNPQSFSNYIMLVMAINTELCGTGSKNL